MTQPPFVRSLRPLNGLGDRTNRWAALVLVAAVGAAVLVGGPRSASAASATIAEVGWWTRDPAATAPPDGGVVVANAPDGALSVSALRIVKPENGAGIVTLAMQEADAVAPLGAGLKVCVTHSRWLAANGGSYDDAPEPACDSGSTPLTRGEDGVWHGDLSDLLDSDSSNASIMVLPDDGAPAAFKLTFGRPALSSTGSPDPTPTTIADVGSGRMPVAAETPSFSLTGPPAAAVVGGTAAVVASPPTDPLVALPTRPRLATDAVEGGTRGGGKDWAQLGRLVLLSLGFGVSVAGLRRAIVVVQPRVRLSALLASLRSRRPA